MRLFRPIIQLMGNLKEGQKFSFIGIILGIPIVILTLLFIVNLNQDIKSTKDRSIGVHYTQLLKELLQDVQLHRAYSINYVNTQMHGKHKLDEKQLDVMNNLENILQYDKEEGQSEIVSDKVSLLYQQWLQMDSTIQHSDIQQLFVEHNNYIVSIIDLLEIISSEYELILAEDKYSYYLINDVIRTLPLLSEQLGLIRGTVVSTEGKLMNESRQIIDQITSAKRYLRELEHNRYVLQLSEPVYENGIDELSESIIQDTYKFLDYVEGGYLSNNFNDSLDEFINYATSIINSNFELYDQETIILIDNMSQNLKKMELFRTLIYTLQIFAFIVTLYCFFGFYLSTNFTLKEMKEESLTTKQQLKQVNKMMSLKVMEAHEEERKRLAMELHDSIGQSLYSILVKLNVADQLIAQGQKTNLLGIMEITEEAMKEIKRISQTLRPGVLDFFGFIPALKSSLEQYSKTYNIEVDFTFSGDKERLDPEIETHLFRICQEALTNVAKHSSANQVYMTINVDEEEISLTIQDNGRGFSTENYVKNQHIDGIGLFSMNERAESLNGSFEIESIEKQGTTINVRIPRSTGHKGAVDNA